MNKIAVIIPYKDSSENLKRCLNSLLNTIPLNCLVVLIDDGSKVEAKNDPLLRDFFANQQIKYLRHDTNQGAAAARNTGIYWCKNNNFDITILLDSDCTVNSNFVQTHYNLHLKYSNVAVIGASIIGIGQTLWSKIDCIMSWFTSLPQSNFREVNNIYHIPTTNMSLKLSMINEQPFNNRLKTGEDVYFCKQLIKNNQKIIFCPEPEIYHYDRDNFSDFILHQYQWAVHTYSVRFDNGQLNLGLRILLAFLFLLIIPLFSLFATIINFIPYIPVSPQSLVFFPLVLLVYFLKGFGIIDGIINPHKALINNKK